MRFGWHIVLWICYSIFKDSEGYLTAVGGYLQEVGE